ncbi:MAG: hypothetical protein K8S87_08725 [Planctomycetes bacterium]|nr:hypothetical protein [Planctomycetota bacterium]
MKHRANLVLVLFLLFFVIISCSKTATNKIDDDNKTPISKDNEENSDKKDDNNGKNLISDEKADSTTTNNKKNTDNNKPVYREKKEEKKVEKNIVFENDQKVRKAVVEINIATRMLNFDKAYAIYKKTKNIKPVSDSSIGKLKTVATAIRPFVEAFRAIYIKKFRKDLVVVFLKNADTYVGTIVEQDRRYGYIVLRNISTNSFVTLRTRDIAERNSVDYDRQKKMRRLEFNEDAEEYIIAKESALKYFILAKLAWRYDMKNDAYKYLQQALNIDDEYIRQTISLLEDKIYKEFMELYKNGEYKEAHRLLTRLIDKYPKANLFKQAANRVNEHMEEVERMKHEEKQRIAAEILAKKKAEEEEFRRRMEEKRKKEADEKKAEDEKAADAKRRKADKLTEIDENSEVLREKLKLPAKKLFEEAQREYRLALKLDKASLPGVEDAEKLLEAAIYHYQLSKRLFQESEKKGMDTLGMIVKINKALFWCRKRRTIH